ncbi:single-strand binding protein [Bifidobacterium pseudolongum subsp. globosum]|uniref:single-stranded DNA-binding protein n=1 Tax=Bifidobacterium pseudolongum TaxID=1694 RepID=UPI0010225949|nr:single-stranded DNA-binding protein [Bifidobacterium pseudolongum]RYQ44206.1 single-strand binding protein [Bifidobacterium pseudolongum subsp. globosum]
MALQQALVTITGNVGNDPTLYGKDPAKPACVFRMGCTRRYLDKTGTWQQLPTTWIAVKAFRSLALNIMGSIRKGNPVIVCGVLGTEEWAGEDGEMHSRLVLEASNVGHDLNYVTTICRRMVKESAGEATTNVRRRPRRRPRRRRPQIQKRPHRSNWSVQPPYRQARVGAPRKPHRLRNPRQEVRHPSNRWNSPMRSRSSRAFRLDYQMCTRSSGLSHMRSSGVTPKAL